MLKIVATKILKKYNWDNSGEKRKLTPDFFTKYFLSHCERKRRGENVERNICVFSIPTFHWGCQLGCWTGTVALTSWFAWCYLSLSYTEKRAIKQSTIIVETDAYHFLSWALSGFGGYLRYYLLRPVVQPPYQPAVLCFFFHLECSLSCFMG